MASEDSISSSRKSAVDDRGDSPRLPSAVAGAFLTKPARCKRASRVDARAKIILSKAGSPYAPEMRRFQNT